MLKPRTEPYHVWLAAYAVANFISELQTSNRAHSLCNDTSRAVMWPYRPHEKKDIMNIPVLRMLKPRKERFTAGAVAGSML